MAVAVLLAGDLAVGDLAEQLDGAVRDRGGLQLAVGISLCSLVTSAISLSAYGAMPFRLLSCQSAFSIRWKPVHWLGLATSLTRASISGSRSPKLSATGSIDS